MLCKQYKCLFVHIPKTAGQSIETAFLSKMGLDWESRESLLLKPNNDPAKGPPRLAHLTAEEYVRHGYLSSTEFNSYVKFSIVRNPWSRLASEYRYMYQPFCSFRDFLDKYFPRPEDDDYGCCQDRYRHIIPQHQFIFGKDGRTLVDEIGRFENLQDDFERIIQGLGLPDVALPHVNKSNSVNAVYTDLYDDETREIVANLYKDDIRIFGYGFGD